MFKVNESSLTIPQSIRNILTQKEIDPNQNQNESKLNGRDV